MSIIRFNLTEEHLKLVKNLKFETIDGHLTTKDSEGDKVCAFGYESLYDEIDLIINGMPEDFDPLNTEPKTFTEEEVSHMDSLWGDMPTVLELRCYFGTLVPGEYKRKFHDHVWKYIG